MKKHTIYTINAFFILLLLTVQFAHAHDKGTVKVDSLVSKALAHNVTGEDKERKITIYLPPSYFTSNKKYPVLYLLHGSGDNHLNFVDEPKIYDTIQGLMDEGISTKQFREIIIVTPNEYTNATGSMYVNSAATGNWEDFTVKELVSYIDKTYRTIAKSESRAIAGHSMGGFGAVYLAMKHPDIFSVVYSMNGGFINFTGELSADNPEIKKFIQAKTIDELFATNSQIAIGTLMVSQAFSPNPTKPPFYADKPYKLQDGKLVLDPVVANKWSEFDVIKMAEKYQANLLKLRGLKFDCGDQEDLKIIEINNRLFSEKLTSLNIPHIFEQYNGDHRNKLWGLKGRIYNEVLPFIFDNIKQ